MNRWLRLPLALSQWAAPPVVTRNRVAGPRAPVELRVDRWGVPHSYARSRADAFFAQGFNVARDRLWRAITYWQFPAMRLEPAVQAGPLGPAPSPST